MIKLREYQRRFDAEIREAMRHNRRVCATAPCGSGKRIWFCDAMTRSVAKGKRVMLVTDRRILVTQARNECQQHGIPCGTIMSDEPRNDEAPIQICSIQTLQSRGWVDNPAADWIIVDECHKSGDQYRRLFDQYPNAWVVGLTATPVGPTDRLLTNIFDVVIEPVKNTELIREGWLVRTQVKCPCEPYLKGVTISRSTGEYSENKLGERVESMFVHADVFKWWEPYSDLQTIVFVPRLKFARYLAEEFSQRGHAAEVIEGATTKDEREALFDRFGRRETRVIVSVDVLREGFDAPVATVAIDLQPNAKLRTFWQKVGRIKRPHEGKQHAVLLDFAGNYWRHLHPDEDPEWPTDSETTTAELLTRKKESTKEPWQCPACAYTLSPWERLRDGICPNCGHKLGKGKRRIVMGNGELKVVSAKQRKQKVRNTAVDQWFASLYPAVRGGYKLNLARIIYKKRTGKWPDPNELPFCPEWGSLDWNRVAAKVFPQLTNRR